MDEQRVIIIIKTPIHIDVKKLHLSNFKISINRAQKPGFQLKNRQAARALMGELKKLQNFKSQ